MSDAISIEPLAAHQEALPTLRDWFEAEWRSYYGPGGRGNALQDLAAYANTGKLPVGLVDLRHGRVCGLAALKAESIATHSHLRPWAAAGFVPASLRGQGIGARLLDGLEEQARLLGFSRIYCATGTSATLLERGGWRFMDSVVHEGEHLLIYRKAL
jgi:GNAT superfamily N-acetyltransferase